MDFETLERVCERNGIAPYGSHVGDEQAMTSAEPTNLQVNVGYRCNLACTHCFLECGPDRTECMSRETMEHVLAAFERHTFTTLDITGGSPEMNPDIEWFIDEASKLGHVIVRSNFAILTDERYAHMIDVYDRNAVELFVSMSCSEEPSVDAVRGTGSYKRICSAWRTLNERGFGRDEGKVISVLFTPAGPSLPMAQDELEPIFRENIRKLEGVEFTNFYCSTNVPLGRFAKRLVRDDALDGYVTMLAEAFNPRSVANIMCTYQVNVDYDGRVYECDSYHAAGAAPVTIDGEPLTVETLANAERVPRHRVQFSPICFTCSAGAGSGCCGNTAS